MQCRQFLATAAVCVTLPVTGVQASYPTSPNRSVTRGVTDEDGTGL